MDTISSAHACASPLDLHPASILASLGTMAERATPAAMLQRLASDGLDRIPLPGSGNTLLRWRMLAAVAAHDLALAKLYEGHTDALAILAELGGDAVPARSLWGVWCAESPAARVVVSGNPARAATVRVNGTKAWCSGADALSHALVSASDDRGQPWLLAVALEQSGVEVAAGGWQAVGMADTGTAEVRFADAEATCIGGSGAYLARPGFWHGGAGIAACWYGAAAQMARMMQASAGEPDAHRLAQLGAVDCAVSAVRELLRASARAIDADPAGNAMALALRARLAVEEAAVTVMRHVGEALGAGPFCRSRHFARLMADLPVFLRQSHARRDQAALGQAVHRARQDWSL